MRIPVRIICSRMKDCVSTLIVSRRKGYVPWLCLVFSLISPRFNSNCRCFKRRIMERSEEEWSVDCSDDEKYETDGKNEWSLNPDDILTLIEALEANNRVLELEWKCPGRRGPSPILSNNRQQDSGSQEYKTEEKSDFDFMDEMSSPRLPVRRIGESTPKGSAKKKTASFNGVLSTMLRHRRLEQQEINLSPKKTESPPVQKT